MKKFIITCLLLPLIASASAQSLQFSESSQKVSLASYLIEQFYVDKVDESKLAEAAITAMAKELDPHSEYLNKEEAKALNEPMQGNFEGIGVQFNMMNDTLFIVQTIAGGPSEKVGIQAGDRIIYVSDTLIAGVKMPNTEIMKRLKGPKGTTVKVKVLRNRERDLIEFNIVRDKIPIYSLDASYMLDKETGYIKLNRFQATTHEEYLKAFNELRSKKMKNLIIDLEGNGGGLLGTAIQLADEFLSDGQLIVYTQGRKVPRDDAKASKKGSFESGKLIILVDETSASASEILTGAIQDWDRGLIVGRRTFGKGLVQRPWPLPDGSMLKLTVARYYTPSGRCVQKAFDDTKKYESDLLDRYNKGEMSNKDSIHFNDSLKYQTLLNSRSVYGGGGIMPDIFVPLDTTRSNEYQRNLIAKGCLIRFTQTYSENHRDELKKKYPEVERYITSFQTSDEMIQSLVEDGKTEKLEPKEGELEKATPLLKIQIKALIARDLFGMNEYYQVINEENEILKKAMEILSTKNMYEQLLKGNKSGK
ncbi:MAG: S41 family peptidase [Bacteroidales bacterium]|nr:S41 family peptidase [Bacteroidales bacterium]